ncbi:MAG TPA: prohibitin family protein [Cyclobacteriaceae bacterium]|nr:prohibitin family protein [Cyclobacteriaceae bacterium]
MKTQLATSMLLLALMSSCAIIRPGEVGIKQTLGKIRRDHMDPGAYGYNPFVSTIKKINTRTVEALNDLDVPTKEGLTVKSEIALLYHVKPEAAKEVYTRYGMNYQEVIVESNFRAVARHIFAMYYAKELFAIDRKKIETEVAEELIDGIESKGFVVDAVLLKSITMPPQIFQAVENRLKSEQEALQMEFVIQKQKKEAERMQIEAEAIKNYNKTISESLSEDLIKWNGVKTLQELVTSNNAKVIITDGKSPMMINEH